MIVEGPDISRIAALIGDPARANMLAALMHGYALTAGELAFEGGIAAATASEHLSKMRDAGLVKQRKQGRHRYFQLAEGMPQLLEHLSCLAAAQGHLRSRPGPRDPALRQCRVCYDHLAGRRAVQLFGFLRDNSLIMGDLHGDGALDLTRDGESFCVSLGIDLATLRATRRPICRPCLDWSERRTHLAGGLGAAFLERFIALGWIERSARSRAMRVTAKGESAFNSLLTA